MSQGSLAMLMSRYFDDDDDTFDPKGELSLCKAITSVIKEHFSRSGKRQQEYKTL